MFEQLEYRIVLQAVTPVAHSEGTIGNQSFAMQTDVRQPDGGFRRVPIITGDTMRHHLRAASTYALLDAAGMLGTTALTEEALRLLFAGGMLTGSAGGAIKLDAYRELCELIPPLGIFGGCAQNRAVPGRLRVGEPLLICDETRHMLPDEVIAWLAATGAETATARKHLEVVQRVRMDPLLDPSKRLLLTDSEQVRVNERLRLSEKAGEEGDDAGREHAKSTMLPRTHERVKAGSLYYWTVGATLLSELEVDTFNMTIAAFLANANVGGKQGTGHGHLRALWGNRVALARPSHAHEAMDMTELAPRVGQTFRRHVADRADRVKEFLQKVEA